VVLADTVVGAVSNDVEPTAPTMSMTWAVADWSRRW
jgi:hypothetical protein